MQYLFIFGGDSGQVFELGDNVRFFVGSVSEKGESARCSVFGKFERGNLAIEKC